MNEFGVTMAFAQTALTDNTLCGSTTDLFIGSGAEPTVDDSNEICVTDSPE